jgi:hypothetical protein
LSTTEGERASYGRDKVIVALVIERVEFGIKFVISLGLRERTSPGTRRASLEKEIRTSFDVGHRHFDVDPILPMVFENNSEQSKLPPRLPWLVSMSNTTLAPAPVFEK